MSRGLRMSIDSLPPSYQAQASSQLSGMALIKKRIADNPSKPLVRTKPSKSPNKTESSYNRDVLGGKGMFEAVTFRLDGGSRYTPDFVTFEDGRMVCHEVKGGWRFGSQGRAATAFRECVEKFKSITFVWAKKGKKDWDYNVFNYGEKEVGDGK